MRHAQTADTAAGRVSDDPTVPLSAAGHAAAMGLAHALHGCAAEALVCSPMMRARQTAHPVAEALGLRTVLIPALAERRMGALAGFSRAQLRAGPHAAALTAWDDAPPQGESLRAVGLRASRALAALPALPVLLVITHAGVIRALVGALDGTPTAARGCIDVPFATVLRRELAPDAMAKLWAHLAEGAAPHGAEAPR